jgi:hypothetical protein
MNKLSFLLVVLLAVVSCKKDEVGIRFKMDYETSFTVPSGNLLNLPFDLFTPDITTNSEAEFEANDTRKDKIQEIKLESLKLQITSPAGKNFDFLKSVDLYIEAEAMNELRFAYVENVADGQTTLEVTTTDDNLAEYIKQDKFGMRAKTVQDKVLDQDVEIKATMVFAVKANPLK